MSKKKSNNLDTPNLKDPKEKSKVRKSLWNSYGGRCAYCRRELPLEDKTLEIEHVISSHYADKFQEKNTVLAYWKLSSDFNLDSFYNLVPSCRKCNSEKGRDGFHRLIGVGLQAASANYGLVTTYKRKLDDIDNFTRFRTSSSLSAEDYYNIASGENSEFEKGDRLFGELASLSDSAVEVMYQLPQYPKLFGCAKIQFKHLPIRGCSINLDQNQLLTHLFYNFGSAVTTSSRRFITGRNETGGQDFISLGSSSFCIPQNHTEQLCTLTDKFASLYIEQLRKYVFEVFRGQSFTRSAQGGFRLIKIRRSLWNLILEFASEHDFGRADSEWHIFDSCLGMLKIYCAVENEDRPDYRLFINYERCEESIFSNCRSADKYVWLCWSQMTATATKRDESAFPLGILWSAEYAYRWLTEKLIPAVIDWRNSKSCPKGKRSPINFLIDRLRNKENKQIDYSGFYDKSEAIEQIFIENINTFVDLVEEVKRLQGFYTVFRDYFIPSETMNAIYKYLVWCFKNFTLNDDSKSYIYGNLGALMSRQTLIELVENKIANNLDVGECFAGEVEMALRTLIEFYNKGFREAEKYEILTEAKISLSALVDDFNHKSFFNSLLEGTPSGKYII